VHIVNYSLFNTVQSTNWTHSISSGINLAAILRNPKGLVGVKVSAEKGYRSHQGRGLGPSSKKHWFFHLKWRVLVHSERSVCPCPRQKNIEFSTWSGIWWVLKMYVWKIVKNSGRVMGLINILLHYCTVMQAICYLKFWTMTKSEKNCIAICVPRPPVIYAHVYILIYNNSSLQSIGSSQVSSQNTSKSQVPKLQLKSQYNASVHKFTHLFAIIHIIIQTKTGFSFSAL